MFDPRNVKSPGPNCLTVLPINRVPVPLMTIKSWYSSWACQVGSKCFSRSSRAKKMLDSSIFIFWIANLLKICVFEVMSVVRLSCDSIFFWAQYPPKDTKSYKLIRGHSNWGIRMVPGYPFKCSNVWLFNNNKSFFYNLTADF